MTSSDSPLLVPEPSDRHVIALLLARIAKTPNRILMSDGSREITSEQLLDAGKKVARSFLDAGLARGDRIVILSGNRCEFSEVWIACALVGIVLIPVNTASKGIQLAYYLNNSRASMIVADAAAMANVENAYAADEHKLKYVKQIWCLDVLPSKINVGAVSVSQFPANDKPIDAIERSAASDMGVVMYTSGTSGPSKGVMCSHAQLYFYGKVTMNSLGVTSDDVLFTCMPMFHINAFNTFYQALISGAKYHVSKKFSVTNFYGDLIAAKATVTYVLGAMVPMLLSRKIDASESAHSVRIALAPGVPAQYHKEFESRTHILIVDGYGSTETNCTISSVIPNLKPGWMGKVIDGFEAKVVDEADNEVPRGTAGELLLRNKEPFSFSLGYFEMPDKTIEAWRNLWFHSGDRVTQDEDGYFRFIDRIKDSIRRRGENISSFEVEQVITSLPGIENVAVYAVPSELAEDEVMCTILMREGDTLDPLDVIKWCETRISYYSIPRFIRFAKELPRTENGKVQKFKLREMGVVEGTWDLTKSGYKVKR